MANCNGVRETEYVIHHGTVQEGGPARLRISLACMYPKASPPLSLNEITGAERMYAKALHSQQSNQNVTRW